VNDSTRARLASVLIALPIVGGRAVAQAQHQVACASAAFCPRPTEGQISLLCSNIGSRSRVEDEDSPLFYNYENTLWEMVGARPGVDSSDVANSRIRTMFRQHRDELICDSPGLHNASVLKYAAQNYFLAFFNYVVKRVRVDVNYADSSDHRTVLDYVDDELTRLRGLGINNAAQVAELDYVRRVLVEAGGAKHAKDLIR
jgi:hypothetical protein